MKSPTSITVAGISTRDLTASFVRRSLAIARQEGSLPFRLSFRIDGTGIRVVVDSQDAILG